MLERDKTYQLAGRHHELSGASEALYKRRELHFRGLPPDQTRLMLSQLNAASGIEAHIAMGGLQVGYSLADHSFEEIETLLEHAGFPLDRSLYGRFRRALIRHAEAIQRRNASSPARLIKETHAVYVKAWERHPHGDHDDTPPDLREIH
ncbi:MAG: hypothetical protein FWD62_04040 [Betaproteobacteria bacterium]|nr:hypothetical protein [Betaproteobacteria bacterium]